LDGATARRLLVDELRALDPELILTFGGNAWSALRRHADPEPVGTYLLPLAHTGGQVRWRFPPDEYVARLDDALAAWRRRR
jgi:uracil-DNA glycosylase